MTDAGQIISVRLRANLVTERAGVNFARTVVENAGSLFKEINLQHDYGHDATIMIAINGQIRPREIALQIKSGASYIKEGACRIPASAAHVHFWANHDLDTIGIVYDPEESMAYWTDLKAAAQGIQRQNGNLDHSFKFEKKLWNRFDNEQFPTVLVPMLLGEAPSVPVHSLITWVRSEDLSTHELGVKILRSRHYTNPKTWECLLAAFLERPSNSLSMEIGIAIAMLLGHSDLAALIRDDVVLGEDQSLAAAGV